ncbi:hypothetical protein B5M09_008137 [Aphanomyces astaci]|uniref:DNA-directed RNA polymerase II subunit RPB9-like zinc ribbon domain-containing protein n=1 Tax=Aphanomyces astaci TaxID=112090 RepID=A0A425DHQ8_APHAT|nr:hypothetical protein B5M09_008137 [Aphanomyces astaci]
MHFCPTCGNLLMVEPDSDGMRFCCQTCPYIFKINQKVETKVPLQRKKVDDVLGGDEAWENVDQTDSKPQHYRMLASTSNLICVCCSALSILRAHQGILYANSNPLCR